MGDRITTAAICDNYTDILAEFTDSSNARIKSGKKYVDDPYTAARYVGNVSWVDADSEERLSGLVDKAATSALNIVTDGQAGQVTDVSPYVADSMDACGLTKQFTTAKTKATAVNQLAADLYTEADNRPWYPKGYNEWLGGDIAWKWTDESCGSSSGYCWTIRVVSDSGCYEGVYAEVNISQNDTIIGWSNDSLGSLPSGKTGKMEFTEYGGSGTKSAQMTELNCR